MLLPQRTLPRRPGVRQAPKRRMVILLGVVSLFFHFAALQGIYWTCRNDPERAEPTAKAHPPEEKKVAFKISLPEPVPDPPKPAPDTSSHRPESTPAKPQKPATAEKPPPPPEGKKTTPQPKAPPPKAKVMKASLRDLQTLGRQHMTLVRQGAFPSLTLSYPDPDAYIQQMYQMGAKTLIYQEGGGALYEIDLLTGRILPVAGKDLSGFSVIKRVIRDERWNPLKDRAASRLKTSPQDLALILVVPQEVETRWVGHQVAVFQHVGIPLDRVQSVDALFTDGRLRVVSLHLLDGSVRAVQDPGCG
jgi:hypothetical protein